MDGFFRDVFINHNYNRNKATLPYKATKSLKKCENAKISCVNIKNIVILPPA
jgi:hypothetical protein